MPTSNNIHDRLVVCTSVFVQLTAFLAHTCIKLGLCSSEWDEIWNVDSWFHALDRNGEFFFTKYMHPTCKNDDVICEKSNLPVQCWQKLSVNVLSLLKYACKLNLSFWNQTKGEFYCLECCTSLHVVLPTFYFKHLGLVYRLSSQT